MNYRQPLLAFWRVVPLTAWFLQVWPAAVVAEQVGIGLVVVSGDYTAVWGVKNSVS